MASGQWGDERAASEGKQAEKKGKEAHDLDLCD
jgi:hypothetical protein